MLLCKGAPKIELKKNVAERVNAADQFTLAVKDAAGTTLIGTSATTTGTATGVQGVSAIAPVTNDIMPPIEMSPRDQPNCSVIGPMKMLAT